MKSTGRLISELTAIVEKVSVDQPVGWIDVIMSCNARVAALASTRRGRSTKVGPRVRLVTQRMRNLGNNQMEDMVLAFWH